MVADKDKPPSRLQIWTLASRPHTLTASISPVFAGYALTLHYCTRLGDEDTSIVDKTRIGWIALQFALFAGLIQIGTNLHNDYADFVKGEFPCMMCMTFSDIPVNSSLCMKSKEPTLTNE